MALLLRLAETGLLLAVGLFMCGLAASSSYWQFLNPKYAWLTMAAGVGVVSLGLAGLFDRARSRRVTELGALVVFLALAGASLILPGMLTDLGGVDPYKGSLTFSGEYLDDAVAEPTVTFDGREYVRINVAELIAGETGGFVHEGGRFVVQGSLARTPELDRAGLVAVTRLLITCCFADASGVVCLVRVDDPEDFTPGAWVRVLGRLAPAPALPETQISIHGALTALRSDRYVLDAENVETPEFSGVPFLFEIRASQPFAY
jgi:hypothetical protein